MSEKNIIYILTILELIEKIKIYTKQFDNADEFVDAEDQLYYTAVLSSILTIGEESKK